MPNIELTRAELAPKGGGFETFEAVYFAVEGARVVLKEQHDNT